MTRLRAALAGAEFGLRRSGPRSSPPPELQAAASSARPPAAHESFGSSSPRCLLLHRVDHPVCDGEFVLSLPDQADSLALLGERLTRGRRQVLLGHDEPRAGVQLDDVARVGAQVDDVADRPERAEVSSGPTGVVRFAEVDLLRAGS